MHHGIRVLLASPAFDGPAGPGQMKRLAAAGHVLTVLEGADLRADSVRLALPGQEALVIGSDPVTCEAMCEAGELRLIVRTGKGTDNIDAGCPRLSGIELHAIKDANTRAVAEYALFAMLAALRRASMLASDAQRGTWRKLIGRELSRRTVGLVGLGLIGQDLARLLGPFGCTLVAFDPGLPQDAWPAGVRQVATLDDLVAVADVVTLHVPAGSLQWAGEAFPVLKPGAVLINTARGSLVRAEDVATRVAGGNLFGAALDVFDPEPFEYSTLNSAENLFLSPHIAGHTEEALNRSAASAVDLILNWSGSGLRGADRSV